MYDELFPIFIFLSFASVFIASVIGIIIGTVSLTKRKRKKKFAQILLSICALLCVATTIFYLRYGHDHRTYWKYNDNWIIGRNIKDVEKRYGEFDEGGVNHTGEAGTASYVVETDLFSPSVVLDYYYINYDENGIVTKVSCRGPRGG